MKKIAVLDILNGNTEIVSIGRVMPLLLALGPDLSVFYCGSGFRHNFPKETAAISRCGIKMVVGDYEAALRKHDCFLASTVMAELPESDLSEGKVFFDKTVSAGKHIIFHPCSSEDVWPPAANFPMGSHILYPLETVFFERMGADSRYILNSANHPVIGRTENRVEGVVVGPLHHSDETLALAKRSKADLKAELADRLGVKFKANLPLLSFVSAHFIRSSYADRGLERLAARANIVVKLLPGAYEEPPYGEPHEGRMLDECYCLAEGENIHKTKDRFLLDLIRYAADVNLVNLLSSNFMTCFVLGLRLVPVYSQQLIFAVPRQEFNFTIWFRDQKQLGVRIMHNISPIEIRAADLLMDRISDEAYWAEYDKALPILQKQHLGNFWIGPKARERAVFFIKRVLDHGSFAPQQDALLRAVKGPVNVQMPTLDFYHQYML